MLQLGMNVVHDCVYSKSGVCKRFFSEDLILKDLIYEPNLGNSL